MLPLPAPLPEAEAKPLALPVPPTLYDFQPVGVVEAVVQAETVTGWVLVGVVLALVLGDWLKLELTLSVALPQALLLAAEDTLGRADALALDELLSLRTLLSVPARVAEPVAHGVAELVISARLAVGAEEREAL